MVKKLSRKLRRDKKDAAKTPSRITNDTVAEHRERVLAGGRRYKYPVQYAKHKLVINTVAIVAAAIIILLGLGYWQLYVAQNSGRFFYRITRVAPLPIASVDGTMARYSDYLVNYRAAEHYLSNFDEIEPESDDGQLQLKYKKRESLDIAIADAYARKIAAEQDVSVADDRVQEALDNMRNAANGQLTEETSEASSQRVLGLSNDDLRLIVGNSLLRSEAAFAVDDRARGIVDEVSAALEDNDDDLEATAKDVNTEEEPDRVTVGSSGLVSLSTSFGGIRASEVAGYEEGEVSEPIKSVTSDGYYFVEVLRKTDTQVSFAFLHVPLTTFNEQLAALKEEGKVHEYITIDLPDEQQAPQEDTQ